MTMAILIAAASGGKRRVSSLCSTTEPSKMQTLLWGATGEQEWTPALTTGILILLITFQKTICSFHNTYQYVIIYFLFFFLTLFWEQSGRNLFANIYV